MNKIGYGDLYCTFCGARLKHHSDICPKCAKPCTDGKYGTALALGAGGVGYSDDTEDPTFKKFKSKNKKAGVIILFIISIIIAIVLLAQKAEPLLVGAVIVIIWIFDIIWFLVSSIPKKDWDGKVEKKRTYRKRVKSTADDDFDTYENVYEIKFRTNDGKKKKLKDLRNSNRYNYFHEGERVRFIGRLKNYEKYDKSRDDVILCAGCNLLRDAREDYCGKCGCKILKVHM